MYYLAAPLRTADYNQLLAPIVRLAGIKRPVPGIGKVDFGSVLDLRNMIELDNTHITLHPYQESIFKVDKLK